MKKTINLFIVILSLFNLNNCIHAQNTSSDDEIIKFLYKFYGDYSKIWSIQPPMPYEILSFKLDSMYQKYCTSNLRDKALKYQENGQDIITKDYSMDTIEYKTIIITKDVSKENIFIITYITNFYLGGNNYRQEQVSFSVKIKNENGVYKIDDVF